MLYGSNLTSNGYPDPLTDSRAPDIIIQAVAGPTRVPAPQSTMTSWSSLLPQPCAVSFMSRTCNETH